MAASGGSTRCSSPPPTSSSSSCSRTRRADARPTGPGASFTFRCRRAVARRSICPLPPPQNRLKLRVEAGEKKYAGGPGHHS
ncbi:MAG: DUF1684 domain-containing protein [Gammaproteobacteria bacterium]|nr:MAG: DUF1684 domain-containing protein [Gammaproteobacteria bacterium]